MAKLLVLLSAFVVAVVAVSTIPHATRQYNRDAADQDVLNKQKTIIKLLHRVHQPNLYQDLAEIGNNYNIEQNFEKYENVEVVKHFMKQYKQEMLPRNKIFSILNHKDLEEMVQLFQVFYYAKDYDTFIKTACWARDRINEGQFIYALTTAVLHRQDTKDVVLPPTYEIQPHFFLSNYVIKQAYEAKMRRENALIEVNNTKFIRNADQEVAYFSEDIGLNQFYSNWNKHLPFWYKQQYGQTQERKGELFYYLHQQLLARYDLERLSNDLPTTQPLRFSKPIKHGYAPHLTYRRGMEFPSRPEYIQLKDVNQIHIQDLEEEEYNHEQNVEGYERRVRDVVEYIKVQDVEDYERRLRDAIDLGYIITEDGTKVQINNEQGIDILGKTVQGYQQYVKNEETDDYYHYNYYYGYLKNAIYKLVGQVTDPQNKYGVAPSVLEHFETAARDPAFYTIHKRINNLFQKHKNQLPHYNHQELEVTGVKVSNVDSDRLVTYFEEYDVDLTNVVDSNTNGNENTQDVIIKARTKRINHKPFTFKMELESDSAKTVLVRVFLGPKYDYYGQEMPLEQKRRYMVELDKFPVQVTAGKNVIERQSRDFNSIVPDHQSTKNLKAMVDSALQGQDTYYVQKQNRQCGLPQRLLLPKGKVGGYPVTFAVVVSEYESNASDAADYQEPLILCGTKDHKYPDTKPMGYPFDRQVVEQEFRVPSIYFKDALIYHKRESTDANRSNL